MSDTHPHLRPSARRSAASRAARRSRAQAQYAYEQPVEGVAYAVGRRLHRRPRGDHDDRRGAGARRPRRPRGRLARERAAAGRGRRRRADALPVAERRLPRPDRRRGGRRVAADGAGGRRALSRVEYDTAEHDVELRLDHPRFYKPEKVNPRFPTDVAHGDLDAGLAAAEVVVDATYSTQPIHNNPMEPHASLAVWDGERPHALRLDPGHVRARAAPIAEVFEPRARAGAGDLPARRRRLRLQGHAAPAGRPRRDRREASSSGPVKVALTRQQLFSMVGYRTPTIQRVRLGAARDGRLRAIDHDAFEQTSTVREFAEQTTLATRHMYAGARPADHAPARRARRADAVVDARARRVPGHVRAGVRDGRAGGRVRHRPDRAADRATSRAEDPEKGIPWSSRNLVACLREGAERFGWADRDPTPGARRDGRWLVGTGVASSTYPVYRAPVAGHGADRRRRRLHGRRSPPRDIGTGARTVLTQIAADALGVDPEQVRMEIGDSDFGQAALAGGSMGTASWGSAVVKAVQGARVRPGRGRGRPSDTSDEVKALSRALTARLRRPVRRGARRRRQRRGAGAARARRLRRRPRHQPEDRALAVHRRHDHGPVDGAARGERHGPEFGDYLNHDLAQYHVRG